MILAILQVRMSSRRLRGKVLRPIRERPMMVCQLERIQRCRTIDHLVVATSTQQDDDAIARVCADIGVDCRRGPLNDVLERFREAAAAYDPAHVVRLTGDCPLTDWSVIDALVMMHTNGGHDYSSNALRRTYPLGLDCEVMTWAALRKAADNAVTQFDREHVTPFLYNPRNGISVGHLVNHTDLSFFRWTVDELEDFLLVEAIYDALYPEKRDFLTSDIINLLRSRPNLRTINSKLVSADDRQRSELFWTSQTDAFTGYGVVN